jgi:SAM-dependent methyltransferase
VSDAPYIYGLSGIPIYFYRCVECKHLFTRSFDYWTPQDLSREIYNDEYVKVDPDYLGLRPRRFAEKLGSYLSDAVKAGCKVLDYGSGSGLLAEFVSSDYQIETFDSFDPYAGNEKSQRPTGKYQLITATEVFEHWVEPTDELSKLRRLLTNDGVLYVTTELQPADIEARGCRGWRYAAPRNGHINLYSNDSLRRLGADAGFTVQSNGCEHIFLPMTSESVAHRPELMRFVRGVLWRSVHISSDALTSVRSIEFDDGWWVLNRPVETSLNSLGGPLESTRKCNPRCCRRWAVSTSTQDLHGD